ncbi:DUF559 domain-containing protein [Kineococcus terrestris]|uniref:DUF559 domain-containing protein n=1 Tax=Kineococcus terrestris TaxID=2044856 RepID=UPI0034DB4056
MDALTALTECGGAARFARLERLVARRELAAAVRRGEVLRPAPGLYALPGCPADVLAATAVGGVRSCHTAATALGLDLVDPLGAPHVTARPGTRAVRAGAVVHRRDVADLDGCTDVLTTCLDCLRCLPRRTALVPVDSALRRGLLDVDDLLAAASRLNRRDPRRGLLRMADPASGSALETVARVDLLDEGYAVRTQRVLEPAGRVDLVVDGWLVVEVDGFAFHSSAGQRREDLRRDAELTRLGHVVLRFDWRQVVHQRSWWLGVVRDTHAAGPGRPLRRGR